MRHVSLEWEDLGAFDLRKPGELIIETLTFDERPGHADKQNCPLILDDYPCGEPPCTCSSPPNL